MAELPFQQVDVFTAMPFKGNPVAVVLDADAVPDEKMQAIARWTNLSETTFVCRPTSPGADYRLRIFTPRGELPFAGHPTIGSAHAALRHGLRPRSPGRLVQECGRGLVPLRIDASGISFALPTPPLSESVPEQVADIAAALGIDRSDILIAATIDVGAVWLTVRLADAKAVIALEPDMLRVAALRPAGLTGVTVFGSHPAGTPAAIEVRSFAPAHGVPEDPVCGSGNGCVAYLRQRESAMTPADYVASQGRRLSRDGRVQVRYSQEAIWLGGESVTCVEGLISL